MKVDIKNRHERTGMLRKTDHYWVDVTVTFSEEEKQIIKQHKKEELILVERGPPHTAKSDGGPSRIPGANSLVGKLVMGSNTWDLRVKNLLKGTDSYDLPDPLAARRYQEELMNQLRNFKDYLTAQAAGTEDASVEL